MTNTIKRISEREIKEMIKKHLNIKGDIEMFFLGGMINPKQIEIRYNG